MMDNDIPQIDRSAFHTLIKADERQCSNAFRLLARVERRTAGLMGFEDEIGVQPELRAAVAVAIHEVLVEIEAAVVKAIASGCQASGLPQEPSGPHNCAGCIGGGPCDAQPDEIVERDCVGCGASPGLRCAKDCPSPHAWYDSDDYGEALGDVPLGNIGGPPSLCDDDEVPQ